MALTQTSYLLDLLAPRAFRQITHQRARPVGVGQRRSGSSAVALQSEEERIEETRTGNTRFEREEAVAGPSQPRSVGEKSQDEERVRSGSAFGRESWGISPGIERLNEESSAGPSRLPILSNSRPRPPRRQRIPLYPGVQSTTSNPSSQSHPQRPSLTSHFIHPNLPPPSTLSSLPTPLTKPSGDLLIRYAQRLDNRQAELSVKDTMGRMRIAPVSWISNPKISRRRVIDTSRMTIGENTNGEQGFGSGDDPPPVIPRAPIPLEQKELRDKSNTWARRMWPSNPLPLTPPSLAKYESNYPYTFICRQHHLILHSPSSKLGFIDALRQLEKLPGVRDGDLISLLHLYLAYPPPSPTKDTLLIPLYQLLLHSPHLTHTRQTLHLLILSTLHLPYTEINLRFEIQNLLTLFQTQWGIIPGCESWRHITRYAVHLEDKAWAREGWEAWWSARNRKERGEDEDAGEVDEGDVVFRFRHLGREFFRWLRIVKVMEGKGWLRQRESFEGLSKRIMGKEGWEWVSEDMDVVHSEDVDVVLEEEGDQL